MSAEQDTTTTAPAQCGELSPSSPPGQCSMPAGHQGDHHAVLLEVDGFVRWSRDWWAQHGPGAYGGKVATAEGGE